MDVLVFVQNNYLYRIDFPLRMGIEKYTTRDVGIIQPCKKNENESESESVVDIAMWAESRKGGARRGTIGPKGDNGRGVRLICR